MRIKRRVAICNADGRPIPGKFKEIIETAELFTMNRLTVLVRLENGDIILRKKKDIIEVAK